MQFTHFCVYGACWARPLLSLSSSLCRLYWSHANGTVLEDPTGKSRPNSMADQHSRRMVTVYGFEIMMSRGVWETKRLRLSKLSVAILVIRQILFRVSGRLWKDIERISKSSLCLLRYFTAD